MRRIAGMAVLVGVCAGVPADAGQKDVALPNLETVLTMRVEGEIGVDANGKVTAYSLKTKVSPKIEALINATVPTWMFYPPIVDGKPVTAKRDMRITLVGRGAGDSYNVQVENVLFSQDKRDWNLPKRGRKAREDAAREEAARRAREPADDISLRLVDTHPKPRYPNYIVNGLVTIEVNIAPDGSILDATPTQCSLYQAGGTAKQLASACKIMEDNAAKAIKHWRVAIDTHGKPIDLPLIATVPVQYAMPHTTDVVTEATAPGNWRLESRTAYRRPKWATDKRFAQRVGTSDSIGGELVPSDSTLQLRDGQLGKVL